MHRPAVMPGRRSRRSCHRTHGSADCSAQLRTGHRRRRRGGAVPIELKSLPNQRLSVPRAWPGPAQALPACVPDGSTSLAATRTSEITRTPRQSHVHRRTVATDASRLARQHRTGNDMTAGILAPETALELPLDIMRVTEVDDAGGVHLEAVMTAGYLVDLNQSGLLALTGNIRPQHNAPTLKGKTRSKVDRWTREQQIARKLVNGSEHLGQDNVEVLSNSVSSRSNKLTAFNTISKGLELFWAAGPVTNADVEAQAAWLISAWKSLVKVRPEFGILPTPARQGVRATSVAGSGVSIHAVIAAMSALYSQSIDPDEAFDRLKQRPTESVDFFAFANPVWANAGVIAKSGNDGNYSVRTSYPTRRAAAKLVTERIGVSVTSI